MADKGIRIACNRKFAELLPQRAELGNTGFRKAVMAYIMEEFDISIASAATHYNHSFKKCKAENPELVKGLGRPEDKKGGRKPKQAAVVDAESIVPETFSLCKSKTGEVVAEGLTLEQAKEAVAKAAAQKKAKLYWK